MDRIAILLDEALARETASAAAFSVGDGGLEVARHVAGATRRIPDPGTPVDARTRFDVASLTKPMATAAIAMTLVDDHALDLAAPIRRWLPAAASTGTVGDLLGHGAGCTAHVELFRAMRAGSPDPRAELVARAAREPTPTAPNVATVYSDLGYIMLGAVLERVGDAPLEELFAARIAAPLGLAARYAPEALPGAVSTELDDRGLVTGLVHDENAFHGGRVCGHAGLFASLDDVATFAAAIVNARAPFRAETLARFATTAAAPGTSWRLGWDTPSTTLGLSHAGDRWPRIGAIGHLGFTGTSIWLDLPRRRWSVLLTNRVHPTRHGTADAIKALRRAVNDAAIELLDG